MRAKRQVTTGLFDPTTVNDRVARAFAVKYETLKTEASAIDFEDMVIRAANLLETCPDLRQTYRDTYPYLLVDEFQDISPADFRLIEFLSENLFAVGDDDQAIYGFRGGDILKLCRNSPLDGMSQNTKSRGTIAPPQRLLNTQEP